MHVKYGVYPIQEEMNEIWIVQNISSTLLDWIYIEMYKEKI